MNTVDSIMALADNYAQVTRWSNDGSSDEVRAALLTALQEFAAERVGDVVAWGTRESFYDAIDKAVENVKNDIRVKTVTMRCDGYDLALPIIDSYSGHVLVGYVAAPQPAQPSEPAQPEQGPST